VTRTATRTARLGFLGVGWIGRSRLEAIATAGDAEVVAVADPADDCRREALALAPGASAAGGLEDLLAAGIDGLVIATPSALHAEQSIAALERGVAVFCQKPLGRTAAETAAVVAAARAADRLLGVDLSYRFTAAMRAVREQVAAGALGRVHAVDLVFHNAYGPDRAWFHDPALSGGGCVVDLGIHLVDLLLWTLGFPAVAARVDRLHRGGRPLAAGEPVAEDLCLAQLELAGGAVARLACSWYLPAGQDASIEATFYGPEAAVSMRNVGGSFYDFRAERWEGTRRVALAEPPDAWSGRAAVDWAARLAAGERFDPEVERLVAVAEALDRIIGREPCGS
jgi:predicted dehydrogenase